MKKIQSIKNYLFTPISSHFLGIFRILFGVIMFFEFRDFYFYLSGPIQDAQFHFTYNNFHWLELIDLDSIAFLYILLFISLVLFILGLFYRIVTLFMFIGHSYGFLVDIGHYNNHYYFYSLILFWFLITDANKTYSIDKLIGRVDKGNTVPRWQILGFQLQVFIVYFFGGIAKLNTDWLNGYPMRLWLYNNSFKFTGWFSTFLQQESTAFIYSYLGLIFDLTAGFLLFFRRTKFLVLIPIIFFHISNHFFWTIGTFPWSMLAVSILFFYPTDFSQKEIKIQIKTTYSKLKKSTITIFFVIWFSFQFLFPLRHIIYKGNPSWTGDGHFFAWRMMLVDISSSIKIRITATNTSEEIDLNIENFLTKQQISKLVRSPKDIVRFCNFLKEDVEAKTEMITPNISLEIWKSINERTPILFNDTSLNYGTLEYNTLQASDWIIPWNTNQQELNFTEIQYQNWDDFSKKNPTQKFYY
jgi:hypothetical protein